MSYLFPLYQTLVLCCGINLADLGLIPSSTISLQSESRSAVTLRSHGLYSPWNSPGQNTGVGSLSLLQGDLPNPGIKARSPALQVDSLPAESQGKPKKTGVGSLSLLEKGSFRPRESNRDLLHCRRILYQLSYHLGM